MSDLKDQIFGKVTGDMDPFKKILSKIPGFKGYMERQARRDSDKLIRDTIFNHFRQLEGRVSDLQRQFIEEGQIEYVDDLERSAIRLREFADRVHTASYGYSGLFDATKINEEELALLYQYDAQLLALEDQISSAIDNVAASIGSDGLKAALRNLQTLSSDAVTAFEKRYEILTQGAQ